MLTLTATDLKARLGEALARAASERIAIERNGRVVAFLVPATPPRPRRAAGKAKPGLTRAQEERLLDLCASGDFRPTRWARAGDRRLLAGLAAMLASTETFDRSRLFALAEALHPGMSSLGEYAAWLREGHVRPDRFLPMLEARLAHQRPR